MTCDLKISGYLSESYKGLVINYREVGGGGASQVLPHKKKKRTEKVFTILKGGTKGLEPV